MSFKTGDDCFAYTGSTLLTGNAAEDLEDPTWTVIPNITEDPSVTGERTEIELRLRGLNDVLHRTGKRKSTIEFTLANDGQAASRTALNLFRTAFNSPTASARVLAVAFCDGPIATVGTEVIAGNWEVTNLSRAEPIEGNVAYSVTLALYSYRIDAIIAA